MFLSEKIFMGLVIISEPAAMTSSYKNKFCLNITIIITSYEASSIHLPSPQHVHLSSILLINPLAPEFSLKF